MGRLRYAREQRRIAGVILGETGERERPQGLGGREGKPPQRTGRGRRPCQDSPARRPGSRPASQDPRCVAAQKADLTETDALGRDNASFLGDGRSCGDLRLPNRCSLALTGRITASRTTAGCCAIDAASPTRGLWKIHGPLSVGRHIAASWLGSEGVAQGDGDGEGEGSPLGSGHHQASVRATDGSCLLESGRRGEKEPALLAVEEERDLYSGAAMTRLGVLAKWRDRLGG
ncbi:hypothetical protein BO71DRAFT_192371 [Aspergillus ellipticus CBS 707.79]|uniref:Uncharacterized protein n=1 Tax=Aspergillus ellipticus CBS 707.79 TaxID=1448320 RepID=A0A319F3L2_9EURO|nr:hypothetical protein BO71DRAFT_192371 [Aspergillus ellipticus CBS 707.79]